MRQPISSQVNSPPGREHPLCRSILHCHLHDRTLGLVRVRNSHVVHKRQRMVQGRDVLAAFVRIRSRLLDRVRVFRPSRDGHVVLVWRAQTTLGHLDCHLDLGRLGLCAHSDFALQADDFHSSLRWLSMLLDRSEHTALLAR